MNCILLSLALLVTLVNCSTHLERVKDIECAYAFAKIDSECGIRFEVIHHDVDVSINATEKYCKNAFVKLESQCKSDDASQCGFKNLELACKSKFIEIRQLRDSKIAKLNGYCIPAIQALKVKCNRTPNPIPVPTEPQVQPVSLTVSNEPQLTSGLSNSHLEAVVAAAPFDASMLNVPIDTANQLPGNASGIQSVLRHGSFTSVEQSLTNVPAAVVEQTLSNVPFATVEQTLANVPNKSNQPHLLGMPVASVEQTLQNVPFASVEQTLSNVPVVSVEQLLSNVSFASVEQTLSNVPVATIEQTLANKPDAIDPNIFPTLPNAQNAPLESDLEKLIKKPKVNSNENVLSLSNGRKIQLKGHNFPNYMYIYLTEK